METIKIGENNMEDVRSLIENDIIESGLDIFFFDEMKIEPKDYIDQMTALAKMFGLDFWEIIRRSCSDSEVNRLHYIYDGNAVSKFAAGSGMKVSKR